MIRIAPGRTLLFSAGLIGIAACTAGAPEAPGGTPAAVDKLQVSGEPKGTAECTMQALQRASFCNTAFEQFGVTTSTTDPSSRLTCYRIRSRWLEPAAGQTMPYGALASSLLVGSDPSDETNENDPRMTVQFTPVAPQRLDAAIWLESAGDAEEDKETIGIIKTAINYCGGGGVAAAAAPVATPAHVPERSGAAGLTPPLMVARVAGMLAPLSQCMQAALEKSEGCTDLDHSLGAERSPDGSKVDLVCYNTTPALASTLSYGGLYGALLGYAIGDRAPADASNTRPRFYTLSLRQTAPQTVEARAWLGPNRIGDDFYLAKFKDALAECGGAVELDPVAPAPPSRHSPPKAGPEPGSGHWR